MATPKTKPSEPDPFDLVEAQSLTEAQIARSDEHADEVWKQTAMEIIFETACSHRHCSSNHVWRRFVAVHGQEYAFHGTHNTSALGPCMRAAAKAGWLQSTNQTEPSEIVGQNDKPCRVWESLIYSPVFAR